MNKIYYGKLFGAFKRLEHRIKKKVVESLNNDIQNSYTLETDWVDKLYGSFVSDIAAETLVSEIRASRQFRHNIEGL